MFVLPAVELVRVVRLLDRILQQSLPPGGAPPRPIECRAILTRPSLFATPLAEHELTWDAWVTGQTSKVCAIRAADPFLRDVRGLCGLVPDLDLPPQDYRVHLFRRQFRADFLDRPWLAGGHVEVLTPPEPGPGGQKIVTVRCLAAAYDAPRYGGLVETAEQILQAHPDWNPAKDLSDKIDEVFGRVFACPIQFPEGAAGGEGPVRVTVNGEAVEVTPREAQVLRVLTEGMPDGLTKGQFEARAGSDARAVLRRLIKKHEPLARSIDHGPDRTKGARYRFRRPGEAPTGGG